MLVFAGCGGGNDLPPPLPVGMQTLTGTLLPTEISLLRRGTHVLQVDGKDVYFVESEKENLRNFERKLVTLEGTVFPNVDTSFLPVLVVSRIVDVLEEKSRGWDVQSLRLRIEVPESWEGQLSDGRAAFRPHGSSGAIVTIERKDTSPVDLRDAEPVVVGSARALRVTDTQTGAQTIVLEQAGGALVFSFLPQNSEQNERFRENWNAILSTVAFSGSEQGGQQNGEQSSTGTGAVNGGEPCGGPAGILCPSGSFCDIQNLQENIGVCRKM